MSKEQEVKEGEVGEAIQHDEHNIIATWNFMINFDYLKLLLQHIHHWSHPKNNTEQLIL